MEEKYYIAILTGLMTLFGVFLTRGFDLLFDLRKEKVERRSLLRTKYEEYSECLHRVVDWVQQMTSCKSIDQLSEMRSNDHMIRMVVLSRLYFPELKKLSLDFQNQIVSFKMFLSKSYYESLQLDVKEDTIGGIAYSFDDSKFRHIRDDIYIIKGHIETSIEKYSDKYTSSNKAFEINDYTLRV